MTRCFLCFFVCFCLFSSLVSGQESGSEQSVYRFAFYNVENYFDIETDSSRDYNEFTPKGEKFWTYKKYQAKRSNIYKVITAISGWEPLTLMGFAEIENEFVLQDLISQTPLSSQAYQVIHFESNDRRGIDVGVIYHPDKFKPLAARPIPVVNPEDTAFRTRDILYVKGLTGHDTIHVFINHWPSRYGGMLQTVGLRQLAAETLKKVTDSICSVSSRANILIMGDFNDEPNDRSLLLLTQSEGACTLENTPLKPVFGNVEGTLKYSGKWDTFDQVIVSDHLLDNREKVSIKTGGASIFDAPFLLEDDKKFMGMKPFRTYTGYRYSGGFSDHLPVYVDISMDD